MGKISVAYYLNKKVRPKFVMSEDGEVELPAFPLYLYLTTRRKTVHKPSAINMYLVEPLSDFWEITEANETKFYRVALMMRYEREMLIGIAEIYDKDFENNQVKTAYRQISSRGFNAKDEYINDLNAYIEFYTEKISDLTARSEKGTTEALFTGKDKEIRDILGKLGALVEVSPKSINGGKMIDLYEEIFDTDDLIPIYVNYVIELFGKKTTNEVVGSLGLSVYAWLFGEGKELVWQTLKAEQDKQKDRTTLPKRLANMSREEYYTEIVPVIDTLCSAKDRIDRAYNEMQRGI